ncbi:MAG: lipoate--protein ligase family protein [Candidatus Bathyarchaeia archaeon]|jgi:lipoate-protein ligase A
MSVNTGRVLNDKSTDPNYGLALDHALLLLNPKSKYPATIRFWRNPCSVILGRGQTLSEEVNQTFCREHKIPIARRITGGGTVYHDEGNINISLFIPKSALEQPNDVKRTTSLFTNLLKESIEMTGIKEIHVDDSNNLLYQDHKVSGAAAYFTRETILHHSTLLLSVDLEKLEGSLIHNIEPRRGRSKYKPTTNLKGLQSENWKKKYVKLLGEKFKLNFLPGNLTLEESALATKLRNTIYINPNWINNGERPIDQMSVN